MNKFRITFADVLSYVALCAFGFISFLGFNFMWNGNSTKSSVWSFFMCILLLIVVVVINKVKSAKRNFRRNAYIEISIFILYLFVSYFTIIPFFHYFTVENRKEQIKTKVVEDIENAMGMFDEYESYANERITLYESQLNTAIIGQNQANANYLSLGFVNTGESNNDQKKRLMRIFEDDLMPDKYDSTKVQAQKWLDHAKETAIQWNPIGLMGVVNAIESESNSWLDDLKEYSESTDKADEGSFDYSITFNSVKEELTKKASPSLFGLLCAIFVHSVILLPYWFGVRDNRSNGLWQSLFSQKENDDTGELGRL